MGQIETIWERQNQKSEAEPHSGKTSEACELGQGDSQTPLPALLGHVACRSVDEKRWVHQVIQGTGPKTSPQAHVAVSSLGRGRAWCALQGDGQQTPQKDVLCPCPVPMLGRQPRRESGLSACLQELCCTAPCLLSASWGQVGGPQALPDPSCRAIVAGRQVGSFPHAGL